MGLTRAARLPSPPAAPFAGPAPPPPCTPASRLPSRAGRFPISFRLLRFAEQRPRHSRLCYSSAHQRHSLPSHSETEQGLRISSRLIASPSPCAALGCFAFPSRAPLCSASPLRCRAGLRRRVILHFKAVARQISEEICLRLATLRFALATPCSALPSPCRAPQSQAFAARIGPSPLHAAALLRRSCSLPVMAELPNAAAYRFVAGPSRGRSFPCCSFANRFTALLFLRRSRLSRAFPSPRRAKQISSFAALGLAGLLRRRAARGRSFPCCSFANRFTALLFLRRSRLSRAFPSPRRAKQISSFAALGLAGLLRRRAARGRALLFRRLPEQIKALPLQRPSPQRHRDARPSHANPLPPTSSRCRRIALKASPRCSVAPPRYAAQIHRHTTPLTALPSRIIATLR